MNIFPILYSRTSLGQIQQWQILLNEDSFYTEEGIVGGAITRSSPTVCGGKNIGKKNGTSPQEQARKEATSKHKKKIESGYFVDIKQIDDETYFQPTLAFKWDDYADEVEWPVYSQPKIDGQRCVSRKTGLFSRNGKPILSAPHIIDDLSAHHAIHPEGIWDGELYTHKFKHDFNAIISLVKKTKPTPDDLAESAKHIEYWVYDMWSPAAAKLGFGERTQLLENAIGLQKSLNPEIRVRYVETTLCHNLEELDALYMRYLDEGFEGQMVRTKDGLYENKRSKNLLKRKTFQDAEFELVDLEEGRGNRAGMATRAILKTKDGIQFEAGMIGSHEYCVDLLAKKDMIVGKMVTVVYQNLTPENNVPRFGKLKQIRDYE